jgi:hypothetical protein
MVYFRTPPSDPLASVPRIRRFRARSPRPPVRSPIPPPLPTPASLFPRNRLRRRRSPCPVVLSPPSPRHARFLLRHLGLGERVCCCSHRHPPPPALLHRSPFNRFIAVTSGSYRSTPSATCSSGSSPSVSCPSLFESGDERSFSPPASASSSGL